MLQSYSSSLAIAPKKFYSGNFDIYFDFHDWGKLDGSIVLPVRAGKVKRSFEGIYLVEDSRIKTAFILEWDNADSLSTITSCYSGEIFTYDFNCECMIMRWLMTSESRLMRMSSAIDTGFEILIDDQCKDYTRETKKVSETVPGDIFKS
jgi:hypothetical protein